MKFVASLLLLCCWLPALAAADDEDEDKSDYIVQSIRWVGNEAISDRALREHILTQATPLLRFWVTYPLREDELEGDMGRIAALYRLRGYYEATATYEIQYSEESPKARVEITIDEGKPVQIEEVSVHLAGGGPPSQHPLIDAKDWRKFRETLPLEQGEIFELDDYRTAREMILKFAAEHGLPEAKLAGGAEVDLAVHQATVRWELIPGRHIRLGEVRISGLKSVDEYILRREIRLEPGQTYSLSALAKTRSRLQNLSLFRWTVVESDPPEAAEPESSAPTTEPPAEAPGEEAPAPEPPETSPPGEATWPVDVRVAERPPRRVRIGGGWGTDTSFRAELSWHHRNFYGGARHVDVAVRYSGIGASLRPTFMEPYFLGTRTQLLITPAIAYEKQEAYTARRILADVQLQRELIEPWSGRVGYRFNRDDVYSVEDEAPGEDDLPEGISINTGPHVGIRRTTIENPLNARNGTYLDLNADSSFSALGSDEDFIRYTADARGFVEVYKTVFAARVLLGTIQNLSDTNADDIPLVERFFSGGSSSMRGFGFRRLGPEDINGDSIGGSSLIESSVEWRIPVYRNLGVVGFVDAAFLGSDAWRWELDRLLYAAGPGLRYDTPAGPIRVDFAWRLNPRDSRGNFRVSASLGHTF